MNDTIKTIMERRSVRAFRDRPIAAHEKSIILKATLRAPTAGNMMLYTIIDVEAGEKKEELSVLCDNQPFIAKAPMVLLFLADMQKWFDLFLHTGAEELAAKKNLDFSPPGEGDLMLACCDALIAAQTSVIAAESLGIGSCYIGDIMENYERVSGLFDLPDYTFPITLVCYGYPKSEVGGRPSSRCSVEDTVFSDTYPKRTGEELLSMHDPMRERHFPEGRFYQDARNIGEHYFLKKYSSGFMEEMNRSVREALKKWRQVQ